LLADTSELSTSKEIQPNVNKGLHWGGGGDYVHFSILNVKIVSGIRGEGIHQLIYNLIRGRIASFPPACFFLAG